MSLIKTSDNELVKNIINNNCCDSFKELKSRHQKVVFNVCAKYCKKTSILNYKDLIENVDFIFGDALTTFREDKSVKFSTWLFNRSRYYVLKLIKELNKDIKCMVLENSEIDYLNNINNKVFAPDNPETKRKELKTQIFSVLENVNDDRVKKIFEYRYFGDKQTKKWKNIAKQVNLSATYTKILHDKTCKMLKNRIERY